MKKAEFKSVFTINNVPFLKGMKQASDYAKRFAAQFARNPFSTTMLAAAKSANVMASGIGKAVSTTARFVGLVSGVKVASFALDKVAEGLRAVSLGSIDAAAQIEDFETTFKVFLGTAKLASERMGELRKFAQATPFELPEIARASQELEVLTHGMISHGEGLRMVGDIAAGVNRNFGEVADTIGRLFSGIREGGEIGEALRSLQLMGAITPHAARNIQATAAVDTAAAWKMAQGEFKRFDGMMNERSKTWNGLMSNFKDSIRNAMAEFGAPIMEQLKPALDMVTKFIEKAAKTQMFAKTLAGGIKYALGLLFEGLAHPRMMLQLLRFGLSAVAGSFIDTLEEGLARITSKFAKMFGNSGLAKLLGFDASKLVYTPGGDGGTSAKWKKFNALMDYMSDVGRDNLSDQMVEKRNTVTARAHRLVSESPLNQLAHRTTSLISGRELRRNAQSVRVEEMARNFISTGQFTTNKPGNVIHRGDHRQAVRRARELLREKTGIDRTNQLLEIQINKFDKAWLQKN